MDCWCFYRVCSTITIKVRTDISSDCAPARKRYISTLWPKYFKLTNIISHLARTEHLRRLYSCCLVQEAVDGARSDAGGHCSVTGSDAGLRTDGRDELGHQKPQGWIEHGAFILFQEDAMPSGLWDGAPWGPVGWLVTGAGKCGCKWLLRSDLPGFNT